MNGSVIGEDYFKLSIFTHQIFSLLELQKYNLKECQKKFPQQ